jgi:hypothetical protein
MVMDFSEKTRIDIVILQHKLGADKRESLSAVPVDPQNRLKDIGPVRKIEVGLVRVYFVNN